MNYCTVVIVKRFLNYLHKDIVIPTIQVRYAKNEQIFTLSQE